MTINIFSAMAGKEICMLRREPAVLIMLFILPVILIFVLGSAYDRLLLESNGKLFEVGYEFAVPGYALMFAYYIIDFLGRSFMDEKSSGTWERISQTVGTSAAAIVGKAAPYWLLAILQLCAIFSLGFLFLDFSRNIQWTYLALTVCSVALNILGIGLMVAAIARSQQQLTAISNLLALGFGAIGGALAPIGSLPDLLQSLARMTPHYYAMDAFDQIFRGAVVPQQIFVDIGILAGTGVFAMLLASGKLLASFQI
jgi:ABC-2 type transport system permease protein